MDMGPVHHNACLLIMPSLCFSALEALCWCTIQIDNYCFVAAKLYYLATDACVSSLSR